MHMRELNVSNDMSMTMDGHHHSSGDSDGGVVQDLVGAGSMSLEEAIAAQKMSQSHSGHSHNSMLAHEHSALLDLFPDASSSGTSVAINGGSWFDPNTWADGKIPESGQSVYIPNGISVVYDGVSDARLDTVGVDGQLHFAVNADTKMVVTSLLTGAESVLTIGVDGNPVAKGVQAEIIIADNPIDLSEDPTQLGNGVVTHGKVEIHGASKAPYLKLAVEPMAGESVLVLDGDVGSWEVGDQIVVMGTKFLGNDSNGVLLTQDEEVTIVDIDAESGTVTLNRPLQYDHNTPDYEGRDGVDNELSVYVGNSSRNVTIASENPDGERGHVMFMHNSDVEVRFTEFYELGRTDKSIPINTNEAWDDNDWSNRGPGIKNGPGEGVIGSARNPGDENVEGRYSVHIHRAGAEQDSELAIIEGNAVTGSPGWGIVHHDSHAAIDYNFVYGVAGAGIVSEDGNETGQWIGNFVTSTVGTGRDPNGKGDANVLTLEKSGDFGIEGVAYESQARQILQQDNIAANSKTAWMFNTSETSTQGPLVDVIQFDPSGNPFDEKERLDEEDASVIDFSGNEIIAVEQGIFTGHRNIDNATDIQQTFSDLTVWEVDGEAVHFFNYTNEYVVKDALFVDVGHAFKVGDKVEGINLSNVHVDGAFMVFEARGWNAEGTYVDVTWNNVTRTMEARNEAGDVIDVTSQIIDGGIVTPLDTITFEAANNSKMALGPDGGELDIRGTLTDSLGEFPFRANAWIRQEVHTFEGLQTNVRSGQMEFILEKYGAIQNTDGSWDLGFFWWAGDRLTGENHAVHIPIDLVGFDDSYLRQFEIPGFTPPSSEFARYYDEGIQSINDDFDDPSSHDGSGHGGHGDTGDGGHGDTGDGGHGDTGDGGHGDTGDGGHGDTGDGGHGDTGDGGHGDTGDGGHGDTGDGGHGDTGDGGHGDTGDGGHGDTGDGGHGDTAATVGTATPATVGTATPATVGMATLATAGTAIPATVGTAIPATVGTAIPATVGTAIPATVGMATLAMAATAIPATVGMAIPATAGMAIPATAGMAMMLT